MAMSFLILSQSLRCLSSFHLVLYCVVPENIHTPPRKGFAVWPPLPSGFSIIGPQNLPPPPLRNFPNFRTPPGNFAISNKVNKEIVLFPRMPNFVSFVYFLLNCVTDKRIPYANSLCTQVTDKFCVFHVLKTFYWILQFCKWNARSHRKHNCTFLALHQEELKHHLKKYM